MGDVKIASKLQKLSESKTIADIFKSVRQFHDYIRSEISASTRNGCMTKPVLFAYKNTAKGEVFICNVIHLFSISITGAIGFENAKIDENRNVDGIRSGEVDFITLEELFNKGYLFKLALCLRSTPFYTTPYIKELIEQVEGNTKNEKTAFEDRIVEAVSVLKNPDLETAILNELYDRGADDPSLEMILKLIVSPDTTRDILNAYQSIEC